MFGLTRRLYFFTAITVAVMAGGLSSCQSIDLFEKVEALPGQQWSSGFKPVFQFDIKDTTVPYQLFVILRHTNKYNYNNIWIKLHTLSPDSTASQAQYELPLATNEKGWLGTGMDDLYEHRIALTPLNQDFYFKKSGQYRFTLEQVMREDPLQHVMNIGFRIEKKTR